MKKPKRADLLSAKRRIKRQIDEYMKVGDPFGVIDAQAALWAVNYVLKHRTEEDNDD